MCAQQIAMTAVSQIAEPVVAQVQTTHRTGNDKITTTAEAVPAVPQPSPETEPELVHLKLHRGPEMPLGLTMVRYARTGEAVLGGVGPGGLIHAWNQANPSEELGAGDILVEVNGHKETWSMLQELAKFGSLELVVHRNPSRGEGWLAEVARLTKKAAQGAAAQKAKQQQKGCCGQSCRVQKQKDLISMSRAVRAGDAGVDYCAICADDVQQDEGIAMLSCGHGFHYACMSRWVAQGKRHVCPLCIRELQ